MFNSKELKPKKFRWMYEDEDKNLFQNLIYRFKEFFVWPIMDNYRRTKERMGRSYAYARFGWLNYDFDMACAWYLFEFKLKRLRKCLNNGHSVQEPEDMKALSELIKIVKRLGNDSIYERKYLREHDKKWGKIESRTEPWINAKGKEMGSTWISWRTNCPESASEELKKEEMNEFRCCFEDAEKDRIRDLDRMKDILVKHGQRWWD